MSNDLFSDVNSIDSRISLTASLLNKIDDFVTEQESEQFCDDIKTVINFQDNQYYVNSNSLFSHYDYDRLFKELKDQEENMPYLLKQH